MYSFFVSILQFFGLLWASFVRLFICKKEQDESTEDIEAGMVNEEKVCPNGTVKDTRVQLLNPPTDGYSETLNYDHPGRLPSRRLSAVDPVKSRIMDATLKQVQDRNTNVVKSVVLTPCTVVALPCSATIEYYDPRAEQNEVKRPKNKRIKHGVQPEHPPVPVDEFFDIPLEKEKILGRGKDSIEDLFDLFPLPPPVSPSGGIRVLLESFIKPSSLPVCPALIITQSSPYNSDEESMASSDSFDSDSDELSACGSPKFLSPEAALYLNNGQLPAAEEPVWPSENTPTEVFEETAFTTMSCISTDLDEPETADYISQDAQELAPCSLTSTSNAHNLVDSYHNVVDGFSKADLQKGDIVDETCLEKETTTAPVSQADVLREILTMSPSEDAIVESLLAQFETSFEFDEECRDSLAWLADQGGLSEEFKARLHRRITLPVLPFQEQSEHSNEESDLPSSATWQRSIEKTLQTFRDAEAEDMDFRDLFYKDSIYFSQSSLHTHELEEDTSSTSLDASRDKPFDDSFESAEKSVESLSVLDVRRDMVIVKAEDQDSVYISDSRMILKDVDQDEAKPDAMPLVHEVRACGNGKAPCIWMATTTDDETDEDQWSSLLELDAYMS